MNKTISIWKRLGAFLLALSLVVGMCPVRAFAEENDLIELKAILTRVDQWANYKEEDGPKPAKQYLYRLTLEPGLAKPEDAKYFWDYDMTDNPADAKDDVYSTESGNTWESNEIRAVGVKVYVDGLTLKVSLPAYGAENIKPSEKSIWEARTIGWLDGQTIELGVPFELGALEPDGVSGVDSGAITSKDIWAVTYEMTADGKYVLNPANVIAGTQTILTREILAGMSETHRDDEVLEANVVYPAYNAQFEVDGKIYSAGDSIYLPEEKDVTVFVSEECGVAAKEYLPAVAGSNGWADAEGGWTTTVAAAAGSITMGSETLKVVLDKEAIQITNTSAYINMEGNTVVNISCTAGASGIDKVTIGGEEVAVTEGKASAVLNGAMDTVEIVAVSRAGIESKATVPVTMALAVEAELESNVAVSEDYYISGDSNIVVTVNGLADNAALAQVKLGDADVTSRLQEQNPAVFTLNEAAGKSIRVTDSLGREATYDVPNYVVDTMVPVVAFELPAEDAPTKYVSAEVHYVTVTITDEGVGLADGIQLHYQTSKNAGDVAFVKETEHKATAQIPVANGETLRWAEVAHMADKLGNYTSYKTAEKAWITVDNTAPVITTNFRTSDPSVKIQGIKTLNGETVAYILLDPAVTDNQEEEEILTVFMDVTITEPNMGGMTKLWNSANGVHTATFSAQVKKHETGALMFEIPATDLAGNAVAEYVVKSGAAEGENELDTGLKLVNNSGMLIGSLNIDRRYPSTGDNTPPTVELTTENAAVNGIYTTDVTFQVNVTDRAGEDSQGIPSGVAEVSFDVNNKNFLSCAWEGDPVTGNYTVKVSIVGEGEANDVTLTTKVSDKAGNAYSYSHQFSVDNQAPRVSVAVNPAAPNATDKKDEKTYDFYKNPVTYTVTVNDLFLDAANSIVDGYGAVQNGENVLATIEGGTMEQRKASVVDLSGKRTEVSFGPIIVDRDAPEIQVWLATKDNQSKYKLSDLNNTVISDELNLHYQVTDQYLKQVEFVCTVGGQQITSGTASGTIELKNGDTLEGWSVKAQDIATNELTAAETVKIITDTVAPVVTVTRDIEPVNSTADYDYFGAPVTYTVTVQDTNQGTSNEVVFVADGTEHKFELNQSNNYTGSFTVNDPQELTDIRITVKDAGGLHPEKIDGVGSFADANNNGTYVWTDAAKHTIVDTVKPTATLTFESNTENVTLSGFYIKNGINYLKLDGADKVDTVKVTATLVIQDRNLDATANVSGEGWTFDCDINDAEGKATMTKTFSVSKHNTNSLHLDAVIRDMAGWLLENGELNVVGVNNTVPAYAVAAGKLEMELVLDFRKPTSGADNEVPVITVTPNAEYVTAEGVALYNSPFAFTTQVADNNSQKEENNSGLGKATYVITDQSGKLKPVNYNKDYANDVYSDAYSIPVAFQSGEQETNSAKLTIYAEDMVGNGIGYEKQFALDTLAPRISGEFDNNSVKNSVFFKADRTLTIKVEDINFNADTTEITTTGAADSAQVPPVYVIGFGEGEHTFSMYSTDRAQNTQNDVTWNDGTQAPMEFIIDKTAPVVKVTQATDATAHTDGATDYYSKEVTYTLTVTETYLDDAESEIRYTIADNKSEVKQQVVLKAENLTKNGNVYTHDFTLANNEVLTGLSFDVIDKAGNPFVLDPESNVNIVKNGANGTYEGHAVAVDTEAPVVTVNRTGEAVQTVEQYDFYREEIEFTVTVTDNFLNPESSGSVNTMSYTIDGVETNVVLNLTEDGSALTGSFDILDAQTFNAMSLQVKDAAGNPAAGVSDDSNVTYTTEADGVLNYDENEIIVDTTAPVATIAIIADDELNAQFYTHNGVSYIKLKNPVTNGIGKDKYKKEAVEVTAVVEVTDRNLSVAPAQKNGLKAHEEDPASWTPANGNWTEANLFNNDGSATYTKTIKVKPNEAKLIELDLTILDLAGYAAAEVPVNPLNGTKLENSPLTQKEGEAGHFVGTLTLDRRQPTTADANPPEIKLVKPKAPSTSSNNLPLYNSGFTFGLSVNDGEDEKVNAGLASVTWTLEGADNFITLNSNGSEFEPGTYEYTQDIVFNVGTNESNNCVLTITAVDNVGNTIIYSEAFAVDTLAPRVEVNYDNNNVKNDKYFKDTRTAKIVVEDINFHADTTIIDTEVTPSGWTHSEDYSEHTAFCEYLKDGDYTFKMSATDLAGNRTSDPTDGDVGQDVVKYGDNAAPQEFTVDMTHPILTVSFDPSTPSGFDNQNVEYYNKITTATVKIDEHNFRAADVQAKFNTAHSLSDFNSNGDEHVATVRYEDGNRYQFSVNYEDLAGNPADGYISPVFSVDTHAPKIEITSGDLTNETMNIVPDDLDLQIRIRDEEENLESYNVKITYLNNNFEWVTVSGPEYFTYASADGGNTIFVNFANIAKEKSYDGIYTVEVVAKDYAGNVQELLPPLVFSLNRFGSTFTTNDPYTIEFLTPNSDGVVYRKTVENKLIIQEINPNRVYTDSTHKVEGSVLTVVVNGSSKQLVKDVDYTLTVTQQGEENPWYIYTYEIDPSVFLDNGEVINGRYSILIYGEDEAGNKNTNEANLMSTVQKDKDGQYTGKIEFVLDTMAPVITTTGIESDEIYNAEYQRMEIFISDSTPATIQVYLNDQQITLSENTVTLPNSTAWLVWDSMASNYILNVPEQTELFGNQNVRIVAADAAGNSAEAEVTDFNVSTNFFVRMINSGWFLAGILLLLAAIIVVVLSKKRNRAAVA